MATMIHNNPIELEGTLPKITFRVTRELRKRLKMFAAKNETSVESVCTDAVVRLMDSSDGKQPRARAS
jgi:hypothetical protein